MSENGQPLRVAHPDIKSQRKLIPRYNRLTLSRVCVLNNYPLRKMWERANKCQVPRQHVWGVDALAARGNLIRFAPFHEPDEDHVLQRLTLKSRGLVGHLDQEAYALQHISKLDAFYCADQTGLAGLALARDFLPQTRLISVVHHPVRHLARRAAVARHDTLVCLSPAVGGELNKTVRRRRTEIVHLPWGPDLTSPLYRASGEGNGIVSTGKSNRDLLTLGSALARTGAPAVVYDLEYRLKTPPSDAVRIVHPGHLAGLDPDSPRGYLTSRVIRDTAAAAIVAIPIADPNRLTGLTEAIDALALAKPIVATRSRYFPFDLEAIGCGLWVDPGDADGWTQALSRLLADPSARTDMGAAGRRFAERGWNYDEFCRGLSGLFAA